MQAQNLNTILILNIQAQNPNPIMSLNMITITNPIPILLRFRT